MNIYDSRHFSKLPCHEDALGLLSEISASAVSHCPRQVDRPLAIYGCGDLGKMAMDYFSRLGIEPVIALDAAPEKYLDDAKWKKIPVTRADAVDDDLKGKTLVAVSIVNYPYAPLQQYLQSNGWTDCIPFYDISESYRVRHPLGNGWFAGPLKTADEDGISSVLSNWSDDISRAHHLQFLAWRRLREEWSFDGAPVVAGDRYFIQEVRSAIGPHDSFADVGAYTGQVSKRFIDTLCSKPKQLWAIEPDPESVASLRRWEASLPSHQSKGIQVLPVAVGAREERKSFFFGLGYASQASQMGTDRINTVPIDSLGIEPDFIKLHLEGSEQEALKGGIKTIQKHRPVIVTTTYHNTMGLWELPLWLMRILEDYHFLMRVHSWCGTGAVMYCIPRERWVPQPRVTS